MIILAFLCVLILVLAFIMFMYHLAKCMDNLDEYERRMMGF